MSWLSWPNSSPILRSCLSSGIAASSRKTRVPAGTRGRLAAGLCHIHLTSAVRVASPAAVAELAPVTLPVRAAPAAGAPLTAPAPLATPLGALQKTGPDQAQDQRPADHDGGLPAGDVFKVVPHGRRIFVSEVVGNLIHLAGQRVRETGNAGLLFGAEMLGGPPQRVSDRPKLIGQLVLALTQAGAGPLSGLLERALRLLDYLVLDVPDLFPRPTTLSRDTLLLPGAALRPTGLRVCHRHRITPLLTVRPLSRRNRLFDGTERSQEVRHLVIRLGRCTLRLVLRTRYKRQFCRGGCGVADHE